MGKLAFFAFSFLPFFGISQKRDTIKNVVIQEVIVRATRAQEGSAMAYSIISKKELQNENLGQDLPYLLKTIPSLIATSDAGAGVGYTGIRIRGSDATRINVTLNGIPLNDSESQGVYWVNTPDLASSVGSIQVQRGVGTSTNGVASFGASINIENQKLSDSSFIEINHSFGSFNTQKYTLTLGSGTWKNFSVEGRLSKISSDGYVERAFSDLVSYAISTSFRAKKSYFRFNVLSGKEKTYQSWNGVPENLLATQRRYNYYTYENQIDDYKQTHYQVLTTHKIGLFTTLDGHLHFTRGKGFFEEFRENDLVSDYGILIQSLIPERSDLVRRRWLDNYFYGSVFSISVENPSKNWKFYAGGGINTYKGVHFGEIISEKIVSKDLSLPYRYYENNAQKDDKNGYSKLYFKPNSRLSFFADIQFRWINYSFLGYNRLLQNVQQEVSLLFFNPKMGIEYSLSEFWQSYASLSVANREPNREDYTQTNQKPSPERLFDYEFGVKFRKNKANFQLNGYFMNYTDQLILTGKINDVGNYTRINVPKSYRLGVEIEGNYLFSKQWTALMNLALSQNKIQKFTQYIDNQNFEFLSTDISFSPSVVGFSQISYFPIPKIEIAWQSKYVGKQYLDNTSSEQKKLNAYFLNDLRFNSSLKSKKLPLITVSFLVNNVFDVLYESNGYTYSYLEGNQAVINNFYYPQAGRNFLLRVGARF